MTFLPQLTYEVAQRPVLVSADGTPIETRYQAVTRADNPAQVFGIYGAGYTPVSSAEFQDLARTLARESGFQLQGFLEFNHGARVLAYLRNPALGMLNAQAQHEYITLGNSHDGSSRLFMAYSHRIIRCQNEFATISRSATARINHTGDVAAKIDDFRRALAAQIGNIEAARRHFERMGKVRIDPKLTERLIHYLLDPGTDNQQATAPVATRAAGQLRASLQAEMTALGKTAWGAFNGVTHYTTHVLRQRERSAVFGRAYTLNNRAYDFLRTL